ncbi:phosphatase PAP2 family protein [Aquirufa aurantiipilula]|uniref:Phosphatase PAP2 family protein n=1 Tax=Aquirufa aurantiipilula TaxID=2696561 RepID=A0ABT6BIV2_9BACT|nr:phosphatase PAP2 family protein [Aquirufa aurantiipilula]MBZ1325888.1 phosphatase PAP2 family protein [Aquirufa aurantiipilula]MDF5690395.1 phosphatase PAP2 family protein [Aquirufa aurantiipilula]
MNQIPASIRSFIRAWLIFEVIVWVYALAFSRFDQMRWINEYHSSIGDLVFRFFTSLAEVFLPLLFAVFLFFKQRKWVLPYLGSYLLSTLITQALKHFVFAGSLRPFAYFRNESYDWYTVPGVFINEFNSMPSGHTAAAWFMFFWMATASKKAPWGVLFAFLAAGVALSRVYLFQHFPIDTAVGAIIGVCSSALVYYLTIFKKSTNESLPSA